MPSRLPVLEGVLQEEVSWLVGIPLKARGCLVALCDVSGVELRSQALSGALTSAAYIQKKSIQQAKALHWSLAPGNVVENMARLSRRHFHEEGRDS